MELLVIKESKRDAADVLIGSAEGLSEVVQGEGVRIGEKVITDALFK